MKTLDSPRPVLLMSSTEARKRRESAIARLRELQCGEKDGTLIKRDVARQAWAEVVSGIRDRVLGLPGKLAPQLAGRKLSEIEIRNLLQSEVENLLSGLANAEL
jgi:hypothetical protein